MTQCQQVLDYIDANGSISAIEAATRLGITSFHRRLTDLKNKQYSFISYRVKEQNRFGEIVEYNRYLINNEGAKK